MPTVNIPSPSGATYPTFINLADANTYEAGAFGKAADAWAAATDTNKSKALSSGYRALSSLTYTVPITDPDLAAALPNANAEYAAALLEGSFTKAMSQSASAKKRVKAGSAEVEYFSSTTVDLSVVAPGGIPATVFAMLSKWLSNADSIGLATASGVDACSSFTQDYGVRYP